MFKSKILRASVLLGGFSFLADLVALLRDRILASHFGASRTLDIYYSAFKIPDLIFNLLVLGALSSAFIPVFIDHYRKDEVGAWRLANNFLTTALLAVVGAAIIIGLGAKWLAPLIMPGFNLAERETAIQLMRLMLLSPILFAVSTILGSVLQSLERFWSYAIAPVFYNAGIIFGAVYFVPLVTQTGRPEVLGLGLGVVFGASLHLAVQFIGVLKAGFKFKFVFDLADLGFRKILKLMVPRTIGLGAYSIDSVVINAIASTLSAGSIAVLNFANNLQFVPIAVIGVSTATAVFPRLSHHVSANEREEFKQKLYRALAGTALIVIPIAAGIAIFSRLIISLIFGVGLFKGASIEATATVLSILMIGVIAQSLIPILSRAFYALHNTKTPVAISIFSILINIGLAIYFTFNLNLGVKGLALAFAIAGNVNFLLLWLSFTKMFKVVE